jgi:uncharacterized Zn-finger protein
MNQQNLTPDSLSEYVNIYWREFHTQYPILHRPTTVINNNPHLPLFIAMITIGMSLGGDNHAHLLAVEMHEELRWEIYSSKSFRHPAKLWEMQTLLLREIFDKMLCTRHQHEMSHTVCPLNVLTTVPRSITHFDAARDDAGWIPLS